MAKNNKVNRPNANGKKTSWYPLMTGILLVQAFHASDKHINVDQTV